MRKFAFAAALAALMSTPAAARDHSGYVGLDLGALFPTGTSVDGKLTDETIDESISANDIATIKYKTGYDAALVAGYDFGMFRLEGEASYKRAALDRLHFPASTVSALSDAGLDIGTGDVPLDDAHVRVLSGMVNGLLDFGGHGFGAYAGAGIGIADVRFSGGGEGSSDTRLAWQLLAGVYAPVSTNVDFGLRYRYFHTGRLKFSETDTFDGDVVTGQLSGHFTSHSLLASLVYNFAAPAAPVLAPAVEVAPPPPPPPATQTCPDGTVILATATCPPPPPPPLPPAKAERG